MNESRQNNDPQVKYHEAVKMPKLNECMEELPERILYGTQNFQLLEYTHLGSECKLTALLDSR